MNYLHTEPSYFLKSATFCQSLKAKQLDFYQGAIIFMDHFNLNKMATLLVLKAFIEKRFKFNFSKNLWRLTCIADILFSYGLKLFFSTSMERIDKLTARKLVSSFPSNKGFVINWSQIFFLRFCLEKVSI